uniref:Multidrug-efflux transporter n=1 Tax=uncultured Thiotrichaceae bacterium TaxID=298394 RepID=A0A6S6U6Y4_9GAMM|nr:MAG: Multi antimicrobial extrusion protein (Na(+)/drug antiporter), MATE family of MDR efflux pumps [uncultured Thiotrichaceae bacterium]
MSSPAVKHDLTQGDEKAHLIRLTLPMIWGIMAIIVVNVVDTVFVGQLGTKPLAAMSFTFPVVMVISSLAFGIGTGASSLVARAIGSKDHSMVRSYATQSIIIAFLIAVIFAVAGWLTIDPLFQLLGAEPVLLPYLQDYMGIWYLGCFLIVVPMVGNSAIRASGDTRLPSYVMMTVALVNLVLDPILIFGLFGFPRLELVGAALATIIAYSVAFVVSLYILKKKLNFLTLGACSRQVSSVWKAILRLAVPAAGTNLIAPLSAAVTTWLVADYGSEAVAGFGVASRIESFGLIILFALSSVMAPFVGQNFGAKRYDRMKRGVTLSFNFSWVWGVVLALLFWLLANSFSGLFTDDPLALAAANQYLYIVPISYGLLGIVYIASNVANGVGEPVPALIMSFLRLVVLYLPLAWGLSAWLGLTGLYIATSLANILVGLGAFYWSRSKCTGAT